MNSNMFGPPGWVVLHVGTDVAVRDNWSAEQYNVFVNRAHWALSCVYCRDSFSRFRQLVPMPCKRPDLWPAWMVQLHNLVNAKLNHAPWPQSDPHPFPVSEFVPSMLDFIFTAALNVAPVTDPQRRRDRLDALCGIMMAAANFFNICAAQAPILHTIQISTGDVFPQVYLWADTLVAPQTLTMEQVRDAYEYRRAKSKTCQHDTIDSDTSSCQ